MRLLCLAVLTALVTLRPSTAAAQGKGRWKEIGRTSSGNVVSIDTRSVKKRKDGIVDAVVRVNFTPPVKRADGKMMTHSRVVAMFDCRKKALAAKENVYYAGAQVAERTVNKMPGFGPALGGSLGAVALDYVCK